MSLDLPVADLITDLGQGPYTVTRRAKATYVNGVAVAGSTSTVGVLGAVWPATGRDLMRLPEGRRAQETVAGVSDTLLLVGGEDAANEADLIAIGGVQWEVQRCGTWSPNIPTFWAFIAQRPNVP